MIERLDHVNLRTSQLERMRAFYEDVVGLQSGPRPPFDFGGAWLYAGDHAIVHLVVVSEQPAPVGALRLEHFALVGRGLPAFIDRLRAHGVAYRQSELVGGGATIVDLHDPDGNRLHIDFRD